MPKGAIYNIIEKAALLKANGQNLDRTKLLLRMRLTTQTGLSMQKYNHASEDSADDIEKVLSVIRSPLVGLSNFKP